MARPFQSLRFNAVEGKDEELRDVGARPLTLRGPGAPRAAGTPEFNSVEAAARFYLARLMQRDKRPTVRGLTAPDRPELVPDLRIQDSKRSPLTLTWTVRFLQTRDSIPIFGSRAVVELDENRELLAAEADVADIGGVSPVAALSPAQALERVADTAGVKWGKLQGLQAPELTFFHDDEHDHWHLAYYFKHIPAAPSGFVKETKTHGIGRSLAQRHPELDYLVDAHEGTILLYWSSTPTVDVPTACRGTDEDGAQREFLGRQVPPSAFEMHDPLRGIRTHDFAFRDVEQDPPPPTPCARCLRPSTIAPPLSPRTSTPCESTISINQS